MVYSDKFVVSVVCSGDIVREIRQNGSDSVYLPFGSDYSLRFKNLHNQRAVVSVEIDGKDVLDGNGLVVDPNSSGELLGFMEGSRVRNNFRFIKKTQKVADHRGDLIDDGFIRVTWRFEEPPIVINTTHHHHHDYHHHHDHWDRRPRWPHFGPLRYRSTEYRTTCNDSFTRGLDQRKGCAEELTSGTVLGGGMSASCDDLVMHDSIGANAESLVRPMAKSIVEPQSFLDSDQSEEGITVKGKDTYQDFNTVNVGTLGEEHVAVIYLRGKDSKGQKLTKPKLVRTKVSCDTCGTKNKSGNRYCMNCGTRLV